MPPLVEIAGRRIGGDEPPYLVAEAGVNHNGSWELALRLVDAAADAGAHAVKFQTFSAEALAAADAPLAGYQQQGAGGAASQVDMLRGLELSADALRACRDRATERGLVFLSTPFDLASVQLLAELGVPAFKVGSGDLTNLVLLRAVVRHGLPVILSTGMSTLVEVDAAVTDLRTHGDPPLVLLHCTSAYPADAHDANLAAMTTMRERYGVPVGYSDHTLGIAVATAAVALGAALIEKHLTLDRSLPGPDHSASLEPAELAALVVAARAAHAAKGDGVKGARPAELDVARAARRSLVVARDIAEGEVLHEDDLGALRPAGGISPLRLDDVVGRRAAHDLSARSVLGPDDVDPPL
jgi:N,N'-diacetyllegionaminate synthase